MDFESTETFRSLLQIVQRMLVRRARYCAPIAERKPEAAEVGCHPSSTIYPSRAPTQPGPVGTRPVPSRRTVPVTSDRNRGLPPGNNFAFEINFESNSLPTASHGCRLKGIKTMKYHFQVILASWVVLLTVLVPVSAYASRTPGSTHTRSQTYHDRTPKAHTHGAHPHHR
jgi:hypothetical protein